MPREHEQAEVHARAYQRALDVATSRAESRRRLGLPIEEDYVDMPEGMTLRHVIPGGDAEP